VRFKACGELARRLKSPGAGPDASDPSRGGRPSCQQDEISGVRDRSRCCSSERRTGVVREVVIFAVLNGIGLLIQDVTVAVNFY
jgi:hypothetical protein